MKEIDFKGKPNEIEGFLNEKFPTQRILRWAIVNKKDDTYKIEVGILGYEKEEQTKIPVEQSYNNDFIVVNVVPTGVRAAVGGYIGDATPTTNVMANIADYVITHPNVLNASFINYGKDNVLYTEGFLLDKFLKGETSLTPCKTLNKIGIVIDRTILEDKIAMYQTINTINTLRCVYGINIAGMEFTDKPIGGKAKLMPSGTFCGEVKNTEFIISAKKLVDEGINAIAIATHIDIEDEHLKRYFDGELPNPYGGTEALISHTISSIFNIPCAHAPILTTEENDIMMNMGIVDPRGAGEVVSAAYIGSILKGLSHAPQPTKQGLTIYDVNAIVVPYTCCGGIPAITAQKYGIPLIVVKNNTTVLDITPEKMGLKNVIIVENYLEAIGIIASLKAGIDFKSLLR